MYWVVGQKHQTLIWEISDDISPRFICKNRRSMYARVSQVMAQFVLKIEKLSHIMARAYCLHPRLWLLVLFVQCFLVLRHQ